MSNEYKIPLVEINLNNADDFHLLRLVLHQCYGAHFLFRGQENDQWGLLSSLERFCFNKTVDDLEDEHYDEYYDATVFVFENEALKAIQRELPNYLLNEPLPDSNDYAGWLALIQHYGGKTRLLDFTKSFYIALFFATHFIQNNKYSKSAVWGVNYISEFLSEFEKESIQFDYLSQRFNNIYKKFYHDEETEKDRYFYWSPS